MTRIISGRAGSLRLDVPKAGTRPTSDRVREAIFSALESWDMVSGSRVLDLYAGSGALGLEAASRGAAEVTLVERHAQAAQVASRNARTVTGAFERGSRGKSDDDAAEAPRIEVAKQSVQAFLEAQVAQDPAPRWDVVLLDPPYDLGERELAANLALIPPLLREDAVVMVERSTRSPRPEWPAGLVPLREKRYGETALWWLEAAQG